MGLGSVKESNGVYLSVAGGFIWNRKAPQGDANYYEQEYERKDGTKATRSGARYGDLTGKVKNVVFRSHDEYGDSVNVTVESNGEKYILSISMGNKNAQDMLRALLVMDLEKDLFIKPYDFVGKDKKRAQGISFRQGGQKLDLKMEGAPTKDKEWFGQANKKQIRRFFEDLADWFVAEIEEKVIPVLDAQPKDEPKQGLGSATSDVSQPEPEAEAPKDEPKAEAKKEEEEITPLKKRKFLRAYIKENYKGKKLPKLEGAELDKWYDLALEDEDLPFEAEPAAKAEVSEGDLDSQLKGLLDK